MSVIHNKVKFCEGLWSQKHDIPSVLHGPGIVKQIPDLTCEMSCNWYIFDVQAKSTETIPVNLQGVQI
jgi:hypothetical protein